MIVDYFRGLWRGIQVGWPRFWFEPRGGQTLSIIRIATGLMLAYIHVIWFIGIGEFFGPDAMIDRQTNVLLHADDWTWTYLRYTDSVPFLVTHQAFAICVSLAMAMGLFLRFTAPLAWFITLMVCHRTTGHLFGLDQVTMMLAFGLAIAYALEPMKAQILPTSFSGWILGNLRLPGNAANNPPLSINTFASRLIQLQLCAMYLFGGFGKMRGNMWWDGSAAWYSAASYEYQSWDMTWIGHWPLLAALLAHATILWEVFYCITIWPRWSRPITLAMAFAVHLFIALYLGMITFGVMMIVANLIFIRPETMRRMFDRSAERTEDAPRVLINS
jgi:hypothetical protein